MAKDGRRDAAVVVTANQPLSTNEESFYYGGSEARPTSFATSVEITLNALHERDVTTDPL